MANRLHVFSVILMTLLVALLFDVMPWPSQHLWWRPELLVMLVIYWVLFLPDKTSMSLVFVVGCLLDVTEGVALGQHAMGLMAIAYLCLLSYQRVRNYRLSHQCFFVFIFVGLFELIGNWSHSLRGANPDSLEFLIPALISAACWPLLWGFMQRLRVWQRVA